MNRGIRLTVLALVLASANTAFGQWSADPSNNLPVGDGANDQVQPKVAPTSDGGCYVSWYDNSIGGYDVRLQRLNARGEEVWAHNGILIADRSVSSTIDYGLTADASDNAVIAFVDDRFSPVKITVQKVDPNGNLLWNGTNGVQVGDGNTLSTPPSVAALSDGSYGVIWNTTTSVISTNIQKLDTNGAPLWGPVVQSDPIVGTQRSFQASDVQPADLGGLVVLFVRCNGNGCGQTVAKHLYAQKYDSNGAPQWGGGLPIALHTSSGLTIGYFPRFIPDGAGGAVFSWYEGGGPRNSYLQHVFSNGTPRFPAAVPSTGVTVNRIRVAGTAAYDSVNDVYYIASDECDSGTQANHTVVVQRITAQVDPPGYLHHWGNDGQTVIGPQGMFQTFSLNCQDTPTGALVSYIWMDNTTQGYVYAARVDGEDAPVVTWNLQTSSNYNNKSNRLRAVKSACGFLIQAFNDAAVGGTDLEVQNVRLDGSFGPPATLLGDMNCDGVINTGDISLFIEAAMDSAAWTLAHPCCEVSHADMNADTNIDGLDIQGFTNALVGP